VLLKMFCRVAASKQSSFRSVTYTVATQAEPLPGMAACSTLYTCTVHVYSRVGVIIDLLIIINFHYHAHHYHFILISVENLVFHYHYTYWHYYTSSFC
jgi:hypothetical protein